MNSTDSSLTIALSRLARPAASGSFDDLRLAMVDRLIEASGRDALDGNTWLEAWQDAVRQVADRVIASAEAAVTAAASRARFPAAALAAMRAPAEQHTVLLNRLLAEGIALEELGASADQDQRRGMALDEAWHRMTGVAVAEQSRWARIAADIDAWRRPWRPLVIASVVLLFVVTVLAGMLGGIVAPPQWFQPVNDWFWSLPWPW
ncbi:MAG TPA: hypothetical protein PLL69_03500 [Gemmatimonadales bacterium]|nr:hypothetical protein [Gemmatimonadales bacterium]